MSLRPARAGRLPEGLRDGDAVEYWIGGKPGSPRARHTGDGVVDGAGLTTFRVTWGRRGEFPGYVKTYGIEVVGRTIFRKAAR